MLVAGSGMGGGFIPLISSLGVEPPKEDPNGASVCEPVFEETSLDVGEFWGFTGMEVTYGRFESSGTISTLPTVEEL